MKVLHRIRGAHLAGLRIVALTGATAALAMAAVALVRSAPLLFGSAAAIAAALLGCERWSVRRSNRPARIRLDEGFGLPPAAELSPNARRRYAPGRRLRPAWRPRLFS